MADIKKFRRKKEPTILNITSHNPIAYNNSKSNFSPTANIFVQKLFSAYCLLLNLIFGPILLWILFD